MKKFETRAVHEAADPLTGALRQPIHMATTFKLPGFGLKLFDALLLETNKPPYAYTRWGNPSNRGLEGRLADLEGAEAAVVTASGMAAVSAFLLTFLSAGDHVVANEVCYAGSVELFGLHLPRFGIEVSLVDTSDVEQVREAIRPNTKVVYVETPANPILRISDIVALSEIAHQAGAILAVDSTWASPVLQQPLALGADYVIHSLTKFINGHGDALGGAVLGPEEGIHKIRNEMIVHLGGVLSPFNAFLINRGIVTLPERMARHSQNAIKVAEFLEKHPRVSRVFYPGLPSHPHHEAAARQMSGGFGGMLTFHLKGGLSAAITMAEKIKIFQYATSLGHAHSLLFYYPTDIYIDSVDYLDDGQKARIREWTGDGLVRASVGLEHIDDLIEDLDQALNAWSMKGLAGRVAYEVLKRVG
ncbi:MAG TPA: aminotransferase class I/II-fold pyridoxal phosphate-dependent enzyme [Anaerolineales bacterium]|nr:aminotransferase class I/II-fold pyridoxal phosphate-dependent enzyme [Anaerolineales bacterium]